MNGSITAEKTGKLIKKDSLGKEISWKKYIFFEI